MDIYSTWNLLCGALNGWRGQKKPTRIVLQPGALRPDANYHMWPGIDDRDDGSQEIRLGKPIARVTDVDIFNHDRMEQIAGVIGEWVSFDRTNIVNRHAGMYWVIGPLTYETGQSPWTTDHRAVAFYCNPKNLDTCLTNLGRVVTPTTLILRNGVPGKDLTQSPWPERKSALQDLIRTHWDLIDEPVRQFLTQQQMGPQAK